MIHRQRRYFAAREACLVTSLLLAAARVDAGFLTVAWDTNSEPDVSGYLLHYGTTPGQYSSIVDVGNATVWMVSNLTEGQPYYFAVLAYSSSGTRSPLSGEVTGIAMPSGAQIVSPPGGTVLPGATVQFQWTNAAASNYALNGGTTLGASNLFDVNAGTALSATVGGLPTNGSTVFVRLSSLVNGIQRLSYYSYTAVTCTFMLSSYSASTPVSGSPASVGVTAPSGCAWNGTSNANWIAVTGGSPGLGNGTVAYSTAANTINSPRTGTLTIAGQTFTVTQPAATRIVSVTGNMNKFGVVQIGSVKTLPMTIGNAGNAPLTVTGITYPAGYSGNWAGAVPAGGSQVVTVTFAPTAVTTYDGTITVNANQTSGTNTIAASGRGRK